MQFIAMFKEITAEQAAKAFRGRADHAKKCDHDRGRVYIFGLGRVAIIWDRDAHAED